MQEVEEVAVEEAEEDEQQQERQRHQQHLLPGRAQDLPLWTAFPNNTPLTGALVSRL